MAKFAEFSFRNCLENSRRHLTAPLWRQEAPESGFIRPLLAALGAPIRDLSRISKQFQRNCLKSLASLKTNASKPTRQSKEGSFRCDMTAISALETLLSDFLDSFRRGILRSSLAGSCIERPPRATKM